MVHPLVEQLKFTRREFERGLRDVTAEDALKRFGSMNCISWIIGHLASHEQRYWYQLRGYPDLVDGLFAITGFGQPASTPPLDEMWAAWHTVTGESNAFLEALTATDLLGSLPHDPRPVPETVGNLLQRVNYHYWYHLGESQAIRQLLGQTELPSFIGNISKEAPFRSE